MFRLVFGPLAAKKTSDTARRPRLTVEAMEARLNPDATLIAASYFDSAIYQFHASTGTLAGPAVLAPYAGGTATGLAGLTIGPDKNLYISNDSSTASTDNDSILRYNLATHTLTTFIDKNTLNAVAAAAVGTPENPNPHFTPAGLLFGPDGDLYVALNGGQSSFDGRIVRFDMNYTGLVPQYAGSQVVFGQGLVQPSRLLFGSAPGDSATLYIAGAAGVAKVANAPAATAATPPAPLIFPGTSGLEYATGLAWAPDGDLLVVDLGYNSPFYNGKVLKFNPDGTPDATPEFTPPFSLAGKFPSDGIFDTAGHFLTANLGPAYPPGLQGSISQFNADGSFNQTLVSSAQFPNTGPGGAAGISPTQLALIPNQAPVVTLPGGAVNYTEDQAGVVLSASATVGDADSPDFNTGTLTASLTANGTADDRLEIQNQGSGAGQINVLSGNVRSGTTVVGTVAGGVGLTPLVVTFTASSTPAIAQAVLRALTFRTVTNAPSTAARTVTVSVTDEDGAAGNTVAATVAVTATNDPPSATTNAGLTLAEGDGKTITEAMLTATDPDDAAIPPSQLVYTITALPAHGTLKRYGVDAAVSQTFTQYDISQFGLSYFNNGDEAAADGFSFTVGDGTDTSAAAAFNITVTPVNDAPAVSTNNGLVVPQGVAVTITQAALETTDPDNTPAQIAYTVTAAPAFGTIQKGGSAVTTFTQADINSGLVSYLNTINNEIADAFSFSVTDGAVTVSDTFHIALTPTNVAPAVTTNAGLTADEGASDVISALELEATDSDAGTPAAQLAFTVTVAPAHGTLMKGGAAVTTFTQADINNSLVSYQNDGNEFVSDSFNVTVSDGTDTSLEVTVPVTVNRVNDAPAVTTNTGVTAAEGAAVTIPQAKLKATDIDGPVGDLTYTVTVVPAHGTLMKGGLAVTTFTQADINNSLVSYQNDGNEFVSDSFKVTVEDAAGGVSSPVVVAVTVTPMNDAPTLLVSPMTVAEGGSAVVTAANLSATDPDNTPAQLTYTVTVAPARGTILRDGVAAATFTQADVNAGLVTYVNNGADVFTDSFSVTVNDGALTAGPATVNVIVTPVNDAPTLATAGPVTAAEGGSAVVTAANLTATDPDNSPAQLTYTVTTPPAHGLLKKGAGVVTTFTQADVLAGSISYVNDGSEFAADAFTVTVSDGAATSAALTVAVTVTPMNDPPVISLNTGVTALEAGSAVITSGKLSATDPDNTAGQLTYTVTADPAHGTVRKGGAAVTTFTQADVNNGLVSYQNDGAEFTADSFKLTVSDGAATSAEATVAVTVTAVNDAPVIAVNTGVVVIQGAAVAIGQAKLEATDVDNTAAQLTFTLTAAPAHGAVRLNGSPLTVNGMFTQADVNAGLVTFQHDNTAGTTDSFNVTVSDGALTAAATVNVTVVTVPAVTRQPGTPAQFAFAGAVATVTFTAAASGRPAPMVQWQVSTDGGMTFANISGATATTLTTTARVLDQFRAVFTNIAGSATSNPATVTAKAGLVVLAAPPAAVTATVGHAVTFSAEATGSTATTVQWQYSSDNGATYSNIPKATMTAYTLPKADASKDGDLFRAVFKNAAGVAASPAAKLTVNYTLTLFKKAQAVTVRAGTPVTLVAQSKTGVTPATFQWAVSVDKGKTYTNITGPTGMAPTLTVTPAPGDPVKRYRATLTTAGVVKPALTPVATVTTVAPPTVGTDPLNAFSAKGKATFTAVAGLNAAKETVVWQVSTDGGVTFTNVIAGVKTTAAKAAKGVTPATPTRSTLTVSTKGLPPGTTSRLYRALIVNAVGQAETALAMLTVVT